MKDQRVRIALILGTTHEGSTTRVADYLQNYISKRDDINLTFIDPKKFNISSNDDGKQDLPEFEKIVKDSDGFIIVAPEYNHSFPGSLKLLLDMVKPKEYLHRALAVCGVSAGILGGARMIESFSSVARELGLVHTKRDLLVPSAKDFFDDSGDPKDKDAFHERIDTFLDELVWMAKSLKYGRENL